METYWHKVVKEIRIQGEDKYVVLVSGLNFGSNSSNPLQLQLLADHITGHLGDEKEQHSVAQIVQVVVAGKFVQILHGILNGQRCVMQPTMYPAMSSIRSMNRKDKELPVLSDSFGEAGSITSPGCRPHSEAGSEKAEMSHVIPTGEVNVDEQDRLSSDVVDMSKASLMILK